MKQLLILVLFLAACSTSQYTPLPEIITFEDTDYGFDAKFNNTAFDLWYGHEKPLDWDRRVDIENEFWNSTYAKCEELGGNIICDGECNYFYGRYCVVGYDDAGKECSSNDDCKGYCDGSELFDWDKLDSNMYEQECPNCVSVCSNEPRNTCSDHMELDNGIVKYGSSVCD